MDTTTRTIRIDLQDQPQAPVDTSARPTVSVTDRPAPQAASSATKRPLPAWGWFVLALLVAVIVAVVATALHTRTTSPAERTTPAAATRSVVPGQAQDRSDVAHGTAGRLVDGTGVPILATGSTAVSQMPAIRRHLPSAHVIGRTSSVSHALGWVAGRASM